MRVLFWNAKGVKPTALRAIVANLNPDLIAIVEPDRSITALATEVAEEREGRRRQRDRGDVEMEDRGRSRSRGRSASPMRVDTSPSPRRSARFGGGDELEPYTKQVYTCNGDRKIFVAFRSTTVGFRRDAILDCQDTLGEGLIATITYSGASVKACILHAAYDEGQSAVPWMNSAFETSKRAGVNLIFGDTNLGALDRDALDNRSYECKFAKSTSNGGNWYDRIYVRSLPPLFGSDEPTEAVQVANCGRVMLANQDWESRGDGVGDADYSPQIGPGDLRTSDGTDHRPILFEVQ